MRVHESTRYNVLHQPMSKSDWVISVDVTLDGMHQSRYHVAYSHHYHHAMTRTGGCRCSRSTHVHLSTWSNQVAEIPVMRAIALWTSTRQNLTKNRSRRTSAKSPLALRVFMLCDIRTCHTDRRVTQISFSKSVSPGTV